MLRWLNVGIAIVILAVSVIIVVRLEKKHNKEKSMLNNSKFNLLTEINSMQDQIDRAIEKSDKQLAESKRIIDSLKKLNNKNELKIRDLKSEIVELKQEKKKLLNQLKN